MPPAVRWSARSAGWLWIFGAALGQCLGYSSQQQRVVLPPSPGQNQQQASYVELKPSQGCSPGYYRENKGLYTGWCVPCNCNGHSNRCQDGSGICINCQHNTAGEHCERCKEGYYWNTIHGSCRVCPCPHSDSFATGCVVTGENVKCSCKPGYTGTRCERCAPGYFGNPQKFGGSCQPCNCNSNGQLGSCDPLNGDCINQEPKDSGPGEECDDCDSCVMTLLNDLATMDDELRLVKSQLQGLSVSAGTLEQIGLLETQTKDLRKNLRAC